jgi:hypothetical protein
MIKVDKKWIGQNVSKCQILSSLIPDVEGVSEGVRYPWYPRRNGGARELGSSLHNRHERTGRMIQHEAKRVFRTPSSTEIAI